MLPFFTEHFGNASSRNHPFGWKAGKAVEQAREQVGVAHRRAVPRRRVHERRDRIEQPRHQGTGARAPRRARRHIVTICTEHRAVLDPCRALERDGFRVTYLDVDREGRIDLDRLRDAVAERHAARQRDVGEQRNRRAASARRDRGRSRTRRARSFIAMPCSLPALLRLDVKELGVDLVSLSAHKMYGPKGIGALYVAKRDPAIDLEALIDGGGHERGYRSGTLNVPAIVGFGKAAELCRESADADAARLRALRDRLWTCAVEPRRHSCERPDGAAPAEQSQRARRRRARRVVVEGDCRRRRGVVGRRVRDRERRAVARAARHRD